MAAFDFPSSPTEGQTFTPPGGPTYRFVSPKWTVLGSSGSVEISDVAPTTPAPGNLWWEADTGKLFVWYDDGTSQQWVEAAGGGRGSPAPSYRNRIINGDFAVDQRFNGGPAIAIVGVIYGADRWYAYMSSGTTGVFRLVRTADSTYDGEYLLVVNSTTADATLVGTDIYMMGQRIEGYLCRDFNWGTVQAKPITISFEISANFTGTLPLAVRNVTGTRTWLGSFPVTPAMVKKVFTIPGDTTGVWEKTNLTGLDITIGQGIGATYHGVAGWQAGNFIGLAGMTNQMAAINQAIYIRNFQVELGSVATEFEPVPYDQQLARCKRYYQTTNYRWAGSITNGISAGNYMWLPEEMRATPTFVATNVSATSFPATPASVAVSPGVISCTRTASATAGGIYQETGTANAEL